MLGLIAFGALPRVAPRSASCQPSPRSSTFVFQTLEPERSFLAASPAYALTTLFGEVGAFVFHFDFLQHIILGGVIDPGAFGPDVEDVFQKEDCNSIL